MTRTAILTFLAAALAAPLFPSRAAAQAGHAAGEVGRYSPPRTWPQAEHDYDLVHQKLAVSFDEAERLVKGEVTTTVIAREATDSIRLNAEQLTIDAATMGGRKIRFDADTSHVTVRLPGRIRAGDTATFTLAYHTHPVRGIYFVPRKHVVWSQGEATETRAWVPTYDNANDKTTWEMLVTADSAMKVLSNGRLVGVEPVNGGAQKVWHWSQDEPASTYLYSVVVGPFTVLRDHWRGKPVDYWVYPDTVGAGWRAFGETPSMIELYSRLTGVPFPWAKYDQSAIPDFTYGGMENVSATTQTDDALEGPGTEPSGSRGLVAHELAHQWFGDYTTTANWANAWLNEGLTTYMESVQEEKTRGWDEAQLEWYGQQRQTMQADTRQARPLVWGEYPGTDPIVLFFSGHIYPKGAQLAHQLRRLLGDSVFWAGMHRFLVDNAHKPVTTPDFAVAFEKTCGCDLDWFFDQWAYGVGYPRLDVARGWDADAGVLTVTVDQTQPVDSVRPLFRFPVTVRVVTADSVVRHEIMVSKQHEAFRIPLPSPPVSFRFDEGGWLMGSVHTDQSVAELADMARHDLDAAGRNWALRALAGSRDSAAVAARRFLVLNEHIAQLRVESIRQIAGGEVASGPGRRSGGAVAADGGEAGAAVSPAADPASIAVVRAALRDPDGGVRAAALRALQRLAPHGLADTAVQMARHDPATETRSSALSVYAELAGTEALATVVAASEPGNPEALRRTAARALAGLHDPRAVDALVRLTDPAESRALRSTSLYGLVAAGDTARALAVAGRGLKDYDPLFATASVQALSRLGTPEARAALEAAEVAEGRVDVKAAIERALAHD